MEQEHQPEITIEEAFEAHYRFLESAEITARNVLAQAQELNTFIYDAVNDHNEDNDFADASFWSQVAELDTNIRTYQAQLHDVGLPFDEKPVVNIIGIEGEVILYGDLVALGSIDDRELDALELQLKKKLGAVSADFGRTRAEMQQRGIPLPQRLAEERPIVRLPATYRHRPHDTKAGGHITFGIFDVFVDLIFAIFNFPFRD